MLICYGICYAKIYKYSTCYYFSSHSARYYTYRISSIFCIAVIF